MLRSHFLIPTLKEIPADAEIISHKLMLRSGMIRKQASGVYSWLPLGLRIVRKVEAIVREEMNAAHAQELLMPAIQPSELWLESERWDKYGPELLRLKDRHQREFCFGPTHEEVITDIVRNEIRSYKQLPLTFYQIQTKFRDEIRPRFGVMRSREFIMKDAYSFHLTDASLQETYERMHLAYTNIFNRLGLKFRPVEADSGSIGGSQSHEFHVLADSGEDAICFSDQSQYAANIEQASALPSNKNRQAGQMDLTKVETPKQHSIEQITKFLKIKPQQCVKTLIVKDSEQKLFALVLRGDHALNLIKAQKLDNIAEPLVLASAEEIQKAIACPPGFIGPVDLKLTLIVDHAAAQLSDFVCGANEIDKHFTGCNWERDVSIPIVADIRNAVAGDPSPDGKGTLSIARGIEVGHIFQLGTEYSSKMKATVLNEAGKSVNMTMGCYGIGITRIVAAAIEQNHDDNGIVWPDTIAPFQVALLPLNMHKSHRVRKAAESLYQDLLNAGIDVLFENTQQRPGVMFATMELIGIPHRIVIAERGLDNNIIEYKGRRDQNTTDIPLDKIISFLREKL